LADVPTTAVTVTDIAELPTPRTGLHISEDVEIQAVHSQCEIPRRAEVETSVLPKPAPSNVTDNPPLVAIFARKTCVITGESKVKKSCNVPSTSDTFSNTFRFDPPLALEAQSNAVGVIHDVVKQLKAARAVLGERS